jgi:hypothetical protein
MASIRNSIQTNRRLLILVVGLLILTISLFARFYFLQKQENRALRIKILSMSENRRNPKPWAQLVTKTASAPTTQTTATPTKIPTQDSTSINPVPLAEQDTQDLALRLDAQMKRAKNVEANILDDNIAIANEIISREPDSYGAYKAKLISLLIKEGKFNQAVDENEVESTLESMAQFNLNSDKLARREASLIAFTNENIQGNEAQLEELAANRDRIEAQLSTIDANSPEALTMNQQLQDIEDKQTELASNIAALENNLNAGTNQMVNEDVVEIPFMRMLAQNDFQGVSDSAQSFIEQFPSSPSGYFYLVRSLELQGQKDQARNVIQNASLPQESRDELIKRLESESSQNPKNYWQKLTF